MTDDEKIKLPPRLPQIMAETTRLKFAMASDPLTGCLLRTLAATKPGGNFLELGTGTGVATAWLLDGMDRRSSLISVEKDETVLAVARKFLGHDRRVDFFQVDAGWWLGHAQCFFFDLIFADSWPGKYDHLDEALDMLNRGGLYVIDDMSPQPNWPEGHERRVAELVSILENRKDLLITKLNWSTGIIIGTKIS